MTVISYTKMWKVDGRGDAGLWYKGRVKILSDNVRMNKQTRKHEPHIIA